MRYLSIDLGDRRTGLAVGDDETKIATPAGRIETSDSHQRLRLIEGAIKEHRPDAIVLGLPLNMDGTEGPAARKARQVAEQIAVRTGLPVHPVDERLTSDSANDRLMGSGLTRKARKRYRDALAAAEILKDFLARERRGEARTDEGG